MGRLEASPDSTAGGKGRRVGRLEASPTQWQEGRGDRGGAVGGVADSMGLSLSERGEMGKDREAWRATVHRVEKSWTRLSNGTTTSE